MSWRRRALAAVALAILAGSCVGTGRSPRNPGGTGVSGGGTGSGGSTGSVVLPASPRRIVGLNGDPYDTLAVSKMKELGAQRIRTTLNWTAYDDPRLVDATGHIYPDGSAPWYPWATWWDIILTASDTAGFETLILINSPPASLATLADGIAAAPGFMAALATLYPGRTWQFLNEMDGDDTNNNGWFHASDPFYTQAQRGELYASILIPVYNAIKAADPTATVITGGFASKGASDQVAFYGGIISGGATGKFDAVAIHFYGTAADQQTNALAMRAAIGSTMPLWLTEFGAGTPLDDQGQFDDLYPKLNANDSLLLFDRIFYFELLDHVAGYGLVLLNGTNRPAYYLLRARTRQ